MVPDGARNQRGARATGRHWAYTTVATLLRRLVVKEFAASDPSAVPHVYRAVVSRDELLDRRLKDAAEEFCDGRAAPLVLALVQGNQFFGGRGGAASAAARRGAAGRSAHTRPSHRETSTERGSDSKLRSGLTGATSMLIWCGKQRSSPGIWPWLPLRSANGENSVSPSFRHGAFWLVVLIKFITPPLVSWPWALDVRSLEWPAACREAAAVVAAKDAPAAIPDSQATELSAASEPARIECEPAPDDEALPAVELAATSPAPSTDAADDAPPFATSRGRAEWPAEVAAASWWQALPGLASIMPGILIAWLLISVAIASGKVSRIVRFRRRLHGAMPAPDFLIAEADRIGRWLGVQVPELLVVDDLGTPMLWCLGRPQLSSDEAREDPFTRSMAGNFDP